MQHSAGKEIIAGWSAKQNIAFSVHFLHSVSPQSSAIPPLPKTCNTGIPSNSRYPSCHLGKCLVGGILHIFTCKLYFRLLVQEKAGCTSLPSISSAHWTITPGLWPFPRAGYQSQSKHVWLRFSPSAKFDDVSFLHGKNDSNSQDRQMKGLNEATPGSGPTCRYSWTAGVSGFPTSLLPAGPPPQHQGLMEIPLHARRKHKGWETVSALKQGAPVQSRLGSTGRPLTTFADHLAMGHGVGTIIQDNKQ